MNKLDEFIKEVNLAFTETIKREDFCRIGFDIDKIEVDYNNTISLYNLVSSFNKLYLEFKKEYETLDKLELGEYIEIVNFSKSEFNQNKYRILRIYVQKPIICNHNNTILYLVEENENLSSFITNRKNDKDYRVIRENIKLNPVTIKKYLDLFEKYELLLETYNYLKRQFVFGNGTDTLFTRIGDNLTSGLTYFKLEYGSSYINSEYFIKLFINLGNDFGIDYDKSEIVLDSENKEVDEELVNKLLNNTYIHKRYLKRK